MKMVYQEMSTEAESESMSSVVCMGHMHVGSIHLIGRNDSQILSSAVIYVTTFFEN